MQKLRNRVIIQEVYPFFSCCQQSAWELEQAESELNDLMRATRDREMSRSESKRSLLLQNEADVAAISAPVFGVIAAEHFIYSYALLQISRRFNHVIQNIDSMDTESKWRVIPPLACGKEIDQSSPALNDLRQLIKARNRIVHPKPTIIDNFTDEQFVRAGERTDRLEQQRHQIAKRAPEIVLSLIGELRAIDKSRTLKKLISDMGFRNV